MASTPETQSIQLVTTPEAAELLRVSEHWIRASRFRPELDGPPFIKIGRSVRYDLRDIEDWVNRRKFRGTHELLPNGEGS